MNFVRAAAKDSRRVRVTLSAAPQATSAALPGDALNPATWTVAEVGGAGETFRVLKTVLPAATEVDVYVGSPLAGHPATIRVSAPTLLDATGALVTPPSQADAAGLGEAVSPAQPRLPGDSVDLMNRQVPDNTSFGGTLVVSADGDYAVERGVELLRKLILRRMTTAPGDFFHLPEYGLGLREKTLVQPARLPLLKKRIEQQVSLEPDVEAVSASVSLGADGVLSVRVRARQRSTGTRFVVEQAVAVQL